MSYQVLARKWRPRTFAETAGQEHVLRTLANALEKGRLHHAYLFTGTRGVGKTTIARILAKCLNCERDGVTAEPCGECGACRAIDEGRFVDLIEVDAASRTKVEDTRDLLDNVPYAPAHGRFKIYLIDEVHMLSTHSFNALLKTLEEPPPHVKFLLATTDPQKLPVTILSRCLQFNLKHLPAALIVEHLARVVGEEGVEAENAALRRLARAAEGSMRDALSLLDQAIAFGGGALRDEDVRSMLGTIEQDFVLALLEALAARDGAEILAIIGRMAERAPDFGEALNEMLAVLHRLTLAQTVPGALADDEPERERLQALAARLPPEDVQLFYQIGVNGRRDLPLAPDPRTGFEMTALRMLAFRPATAETVATTPPAGATRQDQRREVARSKPAPASEPVPQARELAPPAARPEASPPAAETDWHGLVAGLRLGGLVQELANHCDWAGREGDLVRLRIDEGHRHLVNDDRRERLRHALGEHFGETLRLALDVGTAAGETPAAARARTTAERQQAAESHIRGDPNVAALQEAFGAEIVPDSIRPLD